MVDLPDLDDRGDLTDWLEAGHTKEEFFTLVEATPPYSPEEEKPWPDPIAVEVRLPKVEPLDGRMVSEPLERVW